MTQGIIGDMTELGITESFQVKRQVLLSAAEAAEMILRVDDIIKAAPRYVKVVVVDLEMVLIYLCSFVLTDCYHWRQNSHSG